MSWRARPWWLARAAVASLLVGAGCASQTPTSTPSWLCSEEPRIFSLESIGVPAASFGDDILLDGEEVVVLLQPSRIVRLTRTEKPRVLEMLVATRDDGWSAIDRDPTDGSIWVVSDSSFQLLRIAPGGSQSGIRVAGVEGTGGFRDIVATESALYVMPTEGTHGSVWRIDRSGTLLSRDFRPTEVKGSSDELRPPEGLLATNDAREARFLSLKTGEIFGAGPDGGWSTTGRGFQRPLHFDTTSQFLFLRGDPVVLGGPVATHEYLGSGILRLRENREESGLEVCGGGYLAAVAADEAGFAAVTGGGGVISEYRAGRDTPVKSKAIAPVFILGSWRSAAGKATTP
jgi:hypothetical protein